jgi:hypothetical protein
MRKQIIVLAAIMVLALSQRAMAQVEADFSSGGGVRLGYANSTCDASIRGAVRYDSAGLGKIDFCNGTEWRNLKTADAFIALSDTPISYTAAENYYLRVNSTGTAVEFTNKVFPSLTGQPAPSIPTFNDLGDVVLTTPTTGQAVYYNGTNWVNGTTAPAAQAIAAGGTVAANACGSVKEISAAGVVTTSTTDTFTTPAVANKGCCMDVVNSSANNITLDANGNFRTIAAANQVLGQYDAVRVCSNGTFWFQVSAIAANN